MNFLDTYFDYVSPYGGSKRFHEWSALSAISAAMGRKCWIDRGAIKNLYPNLFVVLIANPGIAKKSTTAGIAMSLMEKTEKGLIRMTANKSTPAQLIMDQKDCARTFIYNGKRYVHNSIFAWGNELTTLLSDIGGGSIMFDLLEFYDADDRSYVKKLRKEGTILIDRPCMSLLACTTPFALHADVLKHAAGTGLVSRALFVVEKKSAWVPAHPPTTNNDMLKQQMLLVDELNRIGKMVGTFSWSDDASDLFETFHDECTKELEKFNTILGHYFARRSDHAVKLAMLFAAAESSKMLIKGEHLARAITTLKDIEKDLIWAFGTKIMNKDDDRVKVFLDNIPLRPDKISEEALLDGLLACGYMMLLNRDYFDLVNSLVVSGRIVKLVDENGKNFYTKMEE